uniref:Uncharacterized protein n=1 Tax=viral metagenome TaxID=1070528 RepID=A0A6H1ZL74_9ZZZZ
MTFTRWWDENQNEIKRNISHQNFTGIKADFEACWHDGYTSPPNKPVERSAENEREMKWWLIKDEDVTELQEVLKCAIKERDDQCAASGCLCDLTNTYCSGWLRDALHALDSGCHSTDAIPADCAK